jgi:sugar-specific transcriptional regulator TrmB
VKLAISKLTQLGLSEYEAKAYTALLKERPLSAYEIAKNSSIPTSKVYEVVRKLEKRGMIQAIHGEGSKMFIPVSLDEFIQNFTAFVDSSLSVIRDELKDIKVGMDTSYTWHINDYESLILKAERMVNTAQHTILLSVWPPELSVLYNVLHHSEERGVKVAVLHYGTTSVKVGQVYHHPIEDTIYEKRGVRGFALVVDSLEAIIGRATGRKTEAIWSMNEGFVMTAEDYVRHDIFFNKIARRFAPLLQEKFGRRYEKLVDIYSDEEF